MATSLEKFRKLLAAYEDEVQRKQHKMGKRVDPRDQVTPNPLSGYCSFVRGNQVVWNPSYEVIGTFDTDQRVWVWTWGDPSIDPRLRTRVEEVRKQGMQWGIDLLTSDSLAIGDEHQAWELAIVATAVSRADAMYRMVEGPRQRFLALFDGPPPSRSSTSMRAIRESQMGMAAVNPALGRHPTGAPPASTTAPALGRLPTGGMGGSIPTGMGGALSRQLTPVPSSGVAGAPSPADEREPTTFTRALLGQRLAEAVPWAHQTHVGSVSLLARAIPPGGPVGAVTFDMKLTLRTNNGTPDVPLTASPALEDALVGLWLRCRDKLGAGFRFVTAKFEPSSGPQANVTLEW